MVMSACAPPAVAESTVAEARGEWRHDIDALAFRITGHGGLCVVHRRAFRALAGHPASALECLAYFRAEMVAFEDAARAKIARRGLGFDESLHLTSRDVSPPRSGRSGLP